MRQVFCTLTIATLLIVFGAGCGSSDTEPADQKLADTLAGKPPAKLSSEGVDTTRMNLIDSTVQVHADSFPRPRGRVVNMLVTGVDARLGEGGGRADANHLVRFFLDSGCVEIISIPRGTAADAGFPDTTTFNMLANVRTAKGQSGYFKAVAEIAGITKVDYWVEFGFSQALGLLELMGYRDNASSTLRVLRSRKAYATGDYQRTYNQGQFIRQALLRTFDKTDDFLGQLAMRAALAIVETNLTYETTQGLLDELRRHGFSSQAKDRVWVRVKPEEISHFQVFDFDSTKVAALDKQISNRVDHTIPDTARVTSQSVERRLAGMIARASADSARSAATVIRTLQRPYRQRAWMQVPDRARRNAQRDRICALLVASYRRLGRTEDAKQVEDFLALDKSVNAGTKGD